METYLAGSTILAVEDGMMIAINLPFLWSKDTIIENERLKCGLFLRLTMKPYVPGSIGELTSLMLESLFNSLNFSI